MKLMEVDATRRETGVTEIIDATHETTGTAVCPRVDAAAS